MPEDLIHLVKVSILYVLCCQLIDCFYYTCRNSSELVVLCHNFLRNLTNEKHNRYDRRISRPQVVTVTRFFYIIQQLVESLQGVLCLFIAQRLG